MSSPNASELADLTLTLDEAYEFIQSQVKVSGKTKEELTRFLIELAGEECVLSGQQTVEALQTLAKVLETGDHSPLLEKRGLKFAKIADVQEFVEAKFFLGLKGSIWPSVMETLWDVFHGPRAEQVHEIVLGGAIGTAKSFTAELVLAYQLYKLSCYHSPQLEYGLAPGSSIYFVCQSVSLDKAKKVLFEQFSQKLRVSEYFNKYFPFNKDITSELKFPGNINILPIASGDTSALGFNVLNFLGDELNFMPVVANSARGRFTGEQEYDQAERLYRTISRRLKSRFNKRGHMPGKIVLISSANYPDDFLDRKMKEARDIEAQGRESGVYIVCRSQWEARPPGTFLEDTFFVEVGDNTRRSRIIEKREDAIEPTAIIEVPMDFLDDFRGDIEASIRDIAGIPVGGVDSFIPQREKIYAAAARHSQLHDDKQLFTVDSVDLSILGGVADTLNDAYIEDYIDPLAEYHAHIDLSLTGDSCGIAVAHLGGMKQVGKSYDWSESEKKYVEVPPTEKPVVVVDGVLEVVPPMTDEIDLNAIGDLLELIASRINLTVVTADTYQSAAILQRCRRLINCKGRRVKSGTLSLDRDIAPYMLFKQTIRDDCVDFPNHEKLLFETRELQMSRGRGPTKIDHRPGLGKDCADSVCGAVYTTAMGERGKHFRQKGGEGAQPANTRRIRTGRRLIH